MINPKYKLNSAVVALILLSCFLFSQSLTASGNDRYWVFFADKGNIETLSILKKEEIVRNQLSQEAIERRLVRAPKNAFNKISIVQDLPVNTDYIEVVKQIGFTVHQKSRWFNAISGYASKEILDQISQLPFVKSVERVKKFVEKERIQNTPTIVPLAPGRLYESFDFDYGPSFTQVNFHKIPQLHNQGLSGSGIRIGIFDTGFNLDHPALQHLRQAIIAERDFINNDNITKNQPGDPSNQDDHGTITLSVIGGMDEGELIGPAYNAEYFLAKTEVVNYERHVEEDNWAAAAEWADSLGMDIVSTSLGYSTFEIGEDYTPDDMDGETTIITRAANFLTDRGVIVLSSAGNEGNHNWHIITAPADGRYVIAVGAVSTSNSVASFSSRGPTADGRIKPDVVGLGMNVYGAVSSNQGYGGFNGTSMSCPLIAGICALVLEEFPDLTIYNMVKIIRKSGDTPIPNNDRGWGKVDAVKALTVASSAPAPPTAFSLTDAGRGYLTAHWTNPIANVDGTPLDDFDAINIYERGILLTSFTRSPGDTGRADSAVFIPWGTNLPYYVTAVNNESLPNESTPSNIVYSPLSAPSNFSVKLLGHDPLGKHTTFGIALPQPSPITITIYNMLGQKVKTIFYSGRAILNRLNWDQRNENGMQLASGIYPFRVKTNFGKIDSKVMIIR